MRLTLPCLLPIRYDKIALRGKVPKRSGRKLGIECREHYILNITIDALFARNDRQLKHQRVLAFRQQIHENRFCVRKREGIVMPMRGARLSVQNLATLKPVLLVESQLRLYLTLRSNASSVPGSRHTATFGSRFAAKPRVDVP
jgi:hypothetical protein